MLAAWLALRRGRLPFLELISAALFGLLLEEADQLITESYHYADAWILQLDRAPLVIGLTWALLIAGAMRITDALGVRRRWAPFVDSVLAIMLDLAFDAIAIRMGLWTWRGMGATDGWFGVPAGNFYAWLFVTWAFSFVSRWLRDAARTRPALEWIQLLVPIPAFVIFLVAAGAVLDHQAADRLDERRRVDPVPDRLRRLPRRGGVGRLRPEPRPARRVGHRHPRPPAGVRDPGGDPRLLPRWRSSPLALAAREPVILLTAVILLAAEAPLALLTHGRRSARNPLTRRQRRSVGLTWRLSSRVRRVAGAIDPALWVLAFVGFISSGRHRRHAAAASAVRDRARRASRSCSAC